MGHSTLSFMEALLVIVALAPIGFMIFGKGAVEEIKEHLSDISEGDKE